MSTSNDNDTKDPFIRLLDEINTIILKQNKALKDEDYPELNRLYDRLMKILEEINISEHTPADKEKTLSALKMLKIEIESRQGENEKFIIENMETIKEKLARIKTGSTLKKGYKNAFSQNKRSIIDIKK